VNRNSVGCLKGARARNFRGNVETSDEETENPTLSLYRDLTVVVSSSPLIAFENREENPALSATTSRESGSVIRLRGSVERREDALAPSARGTNADLIDIGPTASSARCTP